MTSNEVIMRLKEDGWIEVIPRTPGSHRHFRHPTKPGKTTVPDPKKEIPLPTLKSIEKQSGLKLR